MNERFRLNSTAIQAWLAREERKQAYISKKLGIGRGTTDSMVNHEHIPRDPKITAKLAELMGIPESELILPRATNKSKTA